ncbi:MAG TPA: succinate dehydrogenase/fumarate reductase iron-sulfur subunit [Planctomycetaceae bacterium]|nr:succinate dehydrogenase/fumarate reductase iron-sulfur subunit [Planctomycetaceae bacterium]
MSDHVTLHIYRGDAEAGEMVEYRVPRQPGMVVLDAVHSVQALHAPDLACRWNCKAGKCGSCSGEVNGKPRLMCMDRLDNYPADEPVAVRPMKTFPVLKDLACDVSWNYEVNKRIPAFQPQAGTDWKFSQAEADRVQEFRKCIECFLCQDVCHVLREHQQHHRFGGPRFFVRLAGLEMHPLDGADRTELVKSDMGIGLCNITKCCTEVCPEHIHITDNAIIPLKERVVDRFYDPVLWLWRKVTGK